MNTAQIAALRPLRDPSFLLVWLAQAISGFGDRITLFALAFITWEITRSALFTAFSIATATVPYALFGSFGGAIADAVGHRRAMIACDVIRAVAIGAIPLTLLLQLPLAVSYVLVFVAALCAAVFRPARVAIIPDLVPRERLAESNSLVYASDRTVEIAGSLLAGVVVALLGVLAFYVDALTFAASAFLLLRMDRREPPPRAITWGRLWRDATDGFAVIAGNTILRANTIFSLIAQLSVPVFNGLMPVLIFRELRLGPEAFGAVEAALAFGAVAAGLTLPSVLGRWRKGPVLIVGFAATGLVLIAVGLAPTFEALLIVCAVAGVTDVLYFVPNVTIAQEAAPPGARGRVFGARIALLNLTWLPMILGAGTLAEMFETRVLIAGAGALTLVTALLGGLVRSVRDVD